MKKKTLHRIEKILLALSIFFLLITISSFIDTSWFKGDMSYSERRVEEILNNSDRMDNLTERGVEKIKNLPVKKFLIGNLEKIKTSKPHLYLSIGISVMLFLMFIFTRFKRVNSLYD